MEFDAEHVLGGTAFMLCGMQVTPACDTAQGTMWQLPGMYYCGTCCTFRKHTPRKETAVRSNSENVFSIQALENNRRIQAQNNAPPDFPAFVRQGYDIKIMADGYDVDDKGLIYKVASYLSLDNSPCRAMSHHWASQPSRPPSIPTRANP